jgi:hypothetical protein
MNLNPTIAELEKKAAEYQAAADALRTLLPYEENGVTPASVSKASAASNSAPAKPAASKSAGRASTKQKSAPQKNPAAAKPASKRTLSPETRAKIAAATKARHEARKQQNAA